MTARGEASSARACERLVERLLFTDGLDWWEVKRTFEAAMIRAAMRRVGYAAKEAALLLGIRPRMLEVLLWDTHRGEGEKGARCRLRHHRQPYAARASTSRVVDLGRYKSEREE